jgi:hypothetical protein
MHRFATDTTLAIFFGVVSLSCPALITLTSSALHHCPSFWTTRTLDDVHPAYNALPIFQDIDTFFLYVAIIFNNLTTCMDMMDFLS